MRRRGGLALVLWLLLLAVVAGGYGVYWKIVHDRARALLMEQIDGWRAQGYQIEWRALATGGFPLKVEAVLTDVRVAPPAGLEPWVWTGERLRVGLRPWALDTIIVSPEGRHSAETRQWGTVDAEAESFTVTLAADSVGLAKMVVDGRHPSAVRRASGATVAAAEALTVRVERWPGDALSYSVVGAVERPEWEGSGPGAPVRLDIDADLAAASVLAATGALDEPTLRAWAQAGGRVEVKTLQIDWGDSAIGATGDLAIDDRGEWNGEVAVESRAPSIAFAHLAQLGAIDPQAARQAGAVADAIARGEDQTARLSFELRSGDVYLLGLRLGRVEGAF
jgi:hypothetical protein